MRKKVKVDKPMIAILDNQDHLLCLLDDYTESNLHTFLQGTAAFFKCSVVQNSDYSQYFKVGNKVSFVWNDISYHFDITATTKNEELVSIQADSLTLELRNEDSRAYKANKAMTFKEYLDVFLFAGDNPIVLGINEVADKKLQLEWEGSEDSVLARLFSLANKFGAEIEFETVLNRHWGLDKIKLNVYREHDDKHQGIGKRRTDILLEYGHNIETIEIEENIDNLKTAIHATGKDGLTPASVLIDEKDADGNRLYYSPIGDGSIRAVQARNQFMSKVNGEGYIAKNWTYETDNPNVLAAQALAELKKISKVEVTVKIKGYEYLGIGDTILAQDTGYNPVLNLEARISEQDIYFDNPENNTSTFTNVEILKSEVDESLINRVKELVEANKTYDVQIMTSNGYSFKNGQGSTTLTARVMDGPRDVTNEFSLTWFKNSTEYAHTASINVQAGSIDELATYLIIAEKDGRERGRNELTVFNVKDGSPGKTPVVHLAWADSADGTVKFTTELPTDWIPKYRGYYVDYTSVASTNPKLYKWERNPDDAAKVADEAKSKADSANTKADNANSKADSAVSVANTAKNTADEASKQTALVNALANTAKSLADKANADAAEANRLIGLANTEIGKLNTNVENTRKDLASAEAELINSISTTTRELTAKISGIDVGGRNLLRDTKDEYTVSISDLSSMVEGRIFEFDTPTKNGEQYVLSFEAKASENGYIMQNHWYHGNYIGSQNPVVKAVDQDGNIQINAPGTDGPTFITLTTEYKRYYIVFDIRDSVGKTKIIVGRINDRKKLSNTGWIKIKEFKLEKGNKVTDWSPAPEDFQSDLSNTSIELSTKITESAAKLRTEMSEKYSTKNDLTTLQGEYNSFKEETAKKISQQVSSIQTIQTDTTEARKLVNDAYSKANSAVTSATNASSTASSALSKASDATNVANSASTNASQAVASANNAVSTASQAKSNADKAIADVASLTKTVSSQSTRIDQTSSRIDQVASGVTEIGGKLDNLSIGGRNLLHGTVDFINVGSSYNSGRLIETGFPLTGEKYKGLAVRGKTNITSQSVASCYSFSNFNMGETYTFSFYAKGSIDTFSCYFYGESGYVKAKAIDTNIGWMPGIYNDGMVMYRKGSGSSKELLDSKIFKRYYVTWQLDNTGDTSVVKRILIRTDNATSGDLYICGEKMEIGNKNTDHSPSPEDDQSQIDGINNNIANNYYAKTTVDSKLSTAVNGITAKYTKDIATQLNNYYDKSTMDRRLTIGDVGIETYVKNTQSQLNNLSIGADNLIINGGNITDISPWDAKYKDKFGIYKHPFYYNGEKNIFRLDATSTNDENYVRSNRFEVKRNTDYTLSLVGFYNGNIRSAEIVFLGRKSTETNVPYSYTKSMPLVLSGGNAVYKTITFNSGDNDTGYIRIDNNGTLSEGNLSTLYFAEVMLVEGNVAKKYQPSSAEFPTLTQYTQVKQQADQLSATVYDSASGLVSKTTQLANSYAIKQLNSSGDILTSLNLNANDQTAEINAKLIRLNGQTKMDDAFITNLVANSIVTNKIKSTEISGDIIKGGTIQGVTFISESGPSRVDIEDGSIGMNYIEAKSDGSIIDHAGTLSPKGLYLYSDNHSDLLGIMEMTYEGFRNVTYDDNGNEVTRYIRFGSEYMSLSPMPTAPGSRNTGIRLYGNECYIDLNGGMIAPDKGTYARLISHPDGTMDIINNRGNVEIITKNSEQLYVNGRKIPQTTPDSNKGIKNIEMQKPGTSGTYLEVVTINNNAFGINVWASDQRLKSNIQSPTQDALTTINQLKVRQFDWKSDNVHEDFGLVAQEVEEILPNAVLKVGDYYQIKDSGLIPVLIGAVQKLSNKVNLLENIIYNTKGSNLL